jgi:8-oxo-dGTP pyrophosphatase MutT (NUDIX family)
VEAERTVISGQRATIAGVEDGIDGDRPAVTAEQPGASDGGSDLLERLRSSLLAAGLGPTRLDIAPAEDPEGRTLAAALVLLYPHRAAGEAELTPHLVLTRRTTALRRHSGQISLPGGRYDPEDGSLLRTALRETEEELGVDPADLTIWGRLEPEHITASHYAVAPFVAHAPRRPDFLPAPAEVDEVIELPLGRLLDPAALEEELWDLQGTARRVSFYRYGEHKIWGATARILSQIVTLLDPAGAEPGTFVGAGGETGRRLAPGDVWPRSVHQPSA